jgi:hypothetical protein
MTASSTQDMRRNSASPMKSLNNALDSVLQKSKDQNGSLKTVWDAFCHITPNQAARRDARKGSAN